MTASTSEEILIGPLAIRFLIEGKASGGSVAMFEFGVPAGANVPVAHSHDGYEETIYGLEGVMTFTVDGDPVDVQAGDVLTIRRGVVHRFDNLGETDASALAIVTSGILGPDYFREIATLAAGARPIRSRSAR